MVLPLVNTRHELGCCCGAPLQGVEDIYANALNRLQRSALLHIFIAQYMQVYRANHHIESLHLTAAEVWFPVLRIVLGGCMSRSFTSYYWRSKSSMIHVPTCVFMRSRLDLPLACHFACLALLGRGACSCASRFHARFLSTPYRETI
jgi:hypothetical protein